MSLGDELTKSQEDNSIWIAKQKAKQQGLYTGETCTNCQRVRIIQGSDNKRRCEKCAWCVEDKDYDYEFLQFIR